MIPRFLVLRCSGESQANSSDELRSRRTEFTEQLNNLFIMSAVRQFGVFLESTGSALEGHPHSAIEAGAARDQHRDQLPSRVDDRIVERRWIPIPIPESEIRPVVQKRLDRCALSR